MQLRREGLPRPARFALELSTLAPADLHTSVSPTTATSKGRAILIKVVYRCPDDAELALRGKNPVGERNHAPGVLRDLVPKIDSRFGAGLRRLAARRVAAFAAGRSRHGAMAFCPEIA